MSKLSLSSILIFVAISTCIGYLEYGYFRTPINTPFMETEQTTVFHSIPLSEIVQGNMQEDGIPSIDDPTFESVGLADVYLNDAGSGLMVQVDGRSRFYPFQLLVWHEIVNDTFRGKSLLITYSPLCAQGMVFERAIGEKEYTFGASGRLWNNNMLMIDHETNSLWSQALAEAVVGDRTGAKLVRYPTRIITWSTFKHVFPNGEVLSRETGSTRDYTQDPYD